MRILQNPTMDSLKRLKHIILGPFIVEKDEKWNDGKAARIFEENWNICTRDNRENCYDPTSILDAFRPLAISAKIFGLFPRYDLSFVHTLEEKRIKLIHVLDYCYSLFFMLIMSGGVIASTTETPSAFIRLDQGTRAGQTDFYVSMTIVYLIMVTGVMSLFTFPTANSTLLKFLEHFVHIDKILRFDGRAEERGFARRALLLNLIIFLVSAGCYSGFYVLEPQGRDVKVRTIDYFMAPLLSVAGIMHLIPTALAMFFINGIGLRLFHFNKLMKEKLKLVSPSYSTCSGFSDYGKELEGNNQKDQNCKDDNDMLTIHVEKLRLIYTELHALGSEVGCIFGGHLVRDFIFSIMGLILYTYILIYVNYGDSISNYVIVSLLDLFLVVKLIVLSTFAQKLTCLGSEGKRMLNRVSLQRVSPNCAMQIQMFINALETPIQISAAGYFNISRQLITSIIGAITTYFIILIQFKLQTCMQNDF